MELDNLNVELRPAKNKDFDFTWSLYRDLMRPLTEELLQWNESGQKAVIQEALAHEGTRIILVNGSNAGWLQVIDTSDELYLGQMYIQPALQNHGIGTTIVRDLCERAKTEGKHLTLDVMKNNRARVFYECLGFRVVGGSEYKLKMQWRGYTSEPSI